MSMFITFAATPAAYSLFVMSDGLMVTGALFLQSRIAPFTLPAIPAPLISPVIASFGLKVTEP